MLFEESYENGKLVKGTVTINGSKNTYKKFRSLLQRNVMFYLEVYHINEADYRKKLQLVFNIDKDGSVSDIKVLNGLGKGPDAAVIRGIKEMKTKWNPATQRGIPVSSRFAIPWSFEYRDN